MAEPSLLCVNCGLTPPTHRRNLPGSYCGEAGLAAPTGPCEAGYYCASGSSTATPGDRDFERYTGETCSTMVVGELNGVCPMGHYCPEGSDAPTQCPPGTESFARGLHAVSECQNCTAGFVCPQSGTVNATVPCAPTFYCPGGDIVPTLVCPTGHFCEGGDAVPAPCAPGTYQNATAQAACRACPAGFYCEEATVVPQVCPKGFACPEGTEYATQVPCPGGTFSNETMLSGTDQCEPCSPGKYCDELGLEIPAGLCESGFYCGRGSNTSTPGDGADWTYSGETCASQSPNEVNGVCPIGHYCPEGSMAPTECPPGRASAARGLHNESECAPCTAGFMCPNASTVTATVRCTPRFFCPGGDVVATELCSAGHFCAGGDAVPEPCVAGTYQDEVGQADCKACPAGYYCGNGTVTPEACPVGSYCPNGTRFGAEFLCPAGTFAPARDYANGSMLTALSDCTPCTPGFYCGAPGLAAPTAECEAGYYCAEGSATATTRPTSGRPAPTRATRSSAASAPWATTATRGPSRRRSARRGRWAPRGASTTSASASPAPGASSAPRAAWSRRT